MYGVCAESCVHPVSGMYGSLPSRRVPMSYAIQKRLLRKLRLYVLRPSTASLPGIRVPRPRKHPTYYFASTTVLYKRIYLLFDNLLLYTIKTKPRSRLARLQTSKYTRVHPHTSLGTAQPSSAPFLDWPQLKLPARPRRVQGHTQANF